MKTPAWMHPGRLTWILILFIFGAGPAPADPSAEVQRWDQLMTDSTRALKQNRLEDSIRLCDQAITLAGGFGPADTHLARSQTLRAEIYLWQKQNDRAEQMFKTAVASCEQAVGTNDPAVVYPLSSLANYYYFVAVRYDEVVPLFQRILNIVDHTPGRSNRDVIMWSRNLGMIYQQTGQYTLAEPQFRRAVALAENDSDWLPHELLTFADFYRVWGKYRPAEKLARRALALREKALAGKDNADAKLDLAVSLDGLGAIYLDWGKVARAEACYRRSLATVETFMSPDQSDLVPRLTGLAAALQAGKKYAEADGLYVRALAIAEQNVGPNDPAVAAILERDAAVLQELKKPAEAQARLARAEAIRKQSVARIN